MREPPQPAHLCQGSVGEANSPGELRVMGEPADPDKGQGQLLETLQDRGREGARESPGQGDS